MTRRRWLLTSLLLALALVGAACGEDDPTTGTGAGTGTGTGTGTGAGGGGQRAVTPPTFAPGTTMAAIQSRGRMVVGTKFDQPLFGLKNPLTGAIEGFDVEVAKLMAQGIFGGSLEDAAKKIEFVETVSKVREPSIVDGKVDLVVATYTINDARKQIVDFAGPYYIAGQDIMVKKENTAIKGVSDLNGRKVCSAQGSTSIQNVAQKAPQADLSITFDTYSKCAEALTDGRVEAVTTDDSILAGLVKDSKGAFKLVGNKFTEEPYGIGLKKGDTAFRNFLNDRLEATYRSGEWRKAFESTVGTAGIPSPEPPPVNRY